MSYGYTAAATLMALLLYLAVTLKVGKARMTYKVKAPATTGNEHFERAYRVQMNTLEQMAFSCRRCGSARCFCPTEPPRRADWSGLSVALFMQSPMSAIPPREGAE